MPPHDELAAYYAARAAEYERIYAKPERQRDLRWLRAAIPHLLAGRSVLEVACGTGYWTALIAPAARSVLATDVSQETLAVAREKALPPGRVTFASADAMALPERLGCFEAAFAGFWWSHVPRRSLPRFIASLHARLLPGAAVVLLDNRYVPGSSTPISRCDARGDTWQRRQLADGRTFEVLKNFPDEPELRARLAPVATALQYRTLEHYWLASYRVSGAAPADA